MEFCSEFDWQKKVVHCQRNSHGAGIKHTARVSVVGRLWIRSNPFVFKIDHGLDPKARVGALRAWLNWAVLGSTENLIKLT